MKLFLYKMGLVFYGICILSLLVVLTATSLVLVAWFLKGLWGSDWSFLAKMAVSTGAFVFYLAALAWVLDDQRLRSASGLE